VRQQAPQGAGCQRQNRTATSLSRFVRARLGRTNARASQLKACRSIRALLGKRVRPCREAPERHLDRLGASADPHPNVAAREAAPAPA